MPYIDFSSIKAAVSIEAAAQFLHLKVKKQGDTIRAACPHCKSDERGLSMTPSKGLWQCFASKKGGDVIALVAHVLDCSQYDAAKKLTELLEEPPAPKRTAPEEEGGKEGERTFQPLSYLNHEHEAVEALGLDPDTARRLGIGYAPKGILRGLVAIPVRLEDGTLAGYVGVREAKLPPRWQLPSAKVIPLKRA